MKDLLQSTQQDALIGPLFDDTDFKTLETAVAYNAAGIDVDIIKSTGVKTDVTLSGSSGDGYWRHVANGQYLLTLSTTHTNTTGWLRLTFKADGVLVAWEDFYVKPANVYGADRGTDLLQVDLQAIDDDAAADQLLEDLVETALGADKKVLISTDAQDLNGTFHVDAKAISGATAAADSVESNIGNLNATVSTRSTHAAADVAALVLVTPAQKLVTDATGRVTVGSNADKTGYGLADDAITAGKFDETTAFPLAAADADETEVVRTGEDGDTAETLSDQLDVVGLGSTAFRFDGTLETAGGQAVANAKIYVSTDEDGDEVFTCVVTGQDGSYHFFAPEAGTYYGHPQHPEYAWDSYIECEVTE